jgi:hypothetical protein
LIPQVHSRPYSYTVVRLVPETHTRVVPYTVARVVPQMHSQTVTYPVCRTVVEHQTYTVPYTVCRMIPQTAVRKVSYTTWQTIPCTTTVCVPRVTPRQVPYKVTRCVPKVCYKQVPVRICCPVSDCGCTSPAAEAPTATPESDPYDSAPAPPAALYNAPAILGAMPAAEPQAEEEKPEPVLIVSMQKKAGADAALDLFTSGLKLYSDGAFDAAAREFAAAAELAPAKAKYVYFQALATYQKGDAVAAAELVKTAVSVENANLGESWGRMMERIQGQHRIWLEEARRQGRQNLAEGASAN